MKFNKNSCDRNLFSSIEGLAMNCSCFNGVRTWNLCLLAVVLLPTILFGFGKNKVQYTPFVWNALPSAYFTLYYHQDQGDLPAITYRLTDNIYRTLGSRFQFTHRQPVPLIVYGDPNLFAQTNVITELLPEAVGGFTELFKNRVVVPFSGSYDEFNHVVHHEMVHAFCYGFLYDQFGGGLLAGGGVQVPLWMMEGMAEYLSSGWNVEADMFLMDCAINGEVPLPGPELDGYMAYKGGQSFLYFLSSSRGEMNFNRFLREFKATKSIDKAAKNVYKKSIEELGKEWSQELKRIYWPEIGRRMLPTKNATAVTSHIDARDFFNLRPRLSPDGKLVVFYSDRRDFTRILITDRAGKIKHEISQNGYGGYFESFHPFRSGLCWSPDGSRLAFVTKSGANDQIRIVDIKKHSLVQTISTRLSSIAGPDWSHDGSMIAFAGVDSGATDLYLCQLKTGQVRRLTKSPATESDPHFSPGDSLLVFSLQDTCLRVDDPPMNTWGAAPSNLAVLRLSNDSCRILATTPWNEKQPCFSPDGRHLMFVADRNGIDNLYCAPVDSLEKARPVTDYIGGCSNPDWAGDGGSVVFTLFQKQGWDVWLMDKPLEKFVGDSLDKTKWIECMLDTARHYFSPAPIKPDSVRTDSSARRTKQVHADTGAIAPAAAIAEKKADSLNRAPTAGVSTKDSISLSSVAPVAAAPRKDSTPPARARPLTIPAPQPYRLKFSPDMVALGLGASSYYGYAGQWVLSLSDIMGDHRITIAGDVESDFTSTLHVFASYMYLKHRLNIGGGAYYYKDYSLGNTTFDYYYHDAELGGFVAASYPFSMFSRLDFQVFGRTITRTPEYLTNDTSIINASGGAYSLNSVIPSLSYSFDNILWGLTGPLNGSRAQASIELSPPIPTLNDPFISAEIDVRNYQHLFRRFVWANRLFIGASQSLSSKPSLCRYFLGGNENWLYSWNSDVNWDQFERNNRNALFSEYVVPFRGWRYYDLTGTRAIVLNTEFRFPFIREISTVFPLPMALRYINGALFADIGNAWDPVDAERNKGIPLPDKLYGGTGFGCRANLGIFVLRYDRGWPIEITRWNWMGAPINYFSLGAEF
jgi:Tol biopolymer transport system component